MKEDASATAFVARLAAQGTTRVTEAAGCRMVWRRFGSGPDVLLVHGGHGSWLHWVRNIEALSARHTVWVPDLPGYGASGDPVGTDLPALVEAVAAGFAQLPCVGDIDLVGFSFGGLTASHLASRLPNVRGLALLGPGGHGGTRRQTIALVDWRRAEGAEALAAAMQQNVAAFMIADPVKVDALALLAYTESCRDTRFRSKQISRAGGLGEALDRFGGPVLVAFGEHDVTADPPAVLASLIDGRDGRRGEIVPGAGHWVQYEADAAINALLLAWLAR
ncbi:MULTISPECIES: alpha/beta fold hydrolase [Cupriavidus]|uniref:Alpha/beta fold hydrolase n=1 Tax=Cupriavidus campinensis TaxID=151783 RepID=A0AAE9I1I9_9BURK|nr:MULTISPECIES: alpha/beta fold hydrolase [Cupriavidus]URF05762.1 alpha/beta fold hydrolase [Cupriavidus campinensis]